MSTEDNKNRLKPSSLLTIWQFGSSPYWGACVIARDPALWASAAWLGERINAPWGPGYSQNCTLRESPQIRAATPAENRLMFANVLR